MPRARIRVAEVFCDCDEVTVDPDGTVHHDEDSECDPDADVAVTIHDLEAGVRSEFYPDEDARYAVVYLLAVDSE